MPFAIDKLTRNKIFSDGLLTSSHLDPYLKWTPFISMLVLNVSGNKQKHSFKEWLSIIAVCEGVQAVITESLKKNLNELRPQPSLSTQSFPSGHTATSFAGAELLRSEFSKEHPVACYSGYVIAVAAAILRLRENKHWLRDVAAGAVIGVMSARLSLMLFHKVKNKKQPIKTTQVLRNNAEPVL
jgi:membrane-associated phospholipid phosphatase